MKQLISKSDTSLKSIKRLIDDGIYVGYIGEEKFELTENKFPNNYKLIGSLNQDNNYEVSLEYKYPIAYKLFYALSFLVSLILLINKKWIIALFPLILLSLIFIVFRIKSKKEINLFTNKFLDFYKREEDK